MCPGLDLISITVEDPKWPESTAPAYTTTAKVSTLPPAFAKAVFKSPPVVLTRSRSPLKDE